MRAAALQNRILIGIIVIYWTGDWKLMTKHIYKIILIIIICAFLIVGLLVSASLINSKRITTMQAEKSLSYICETYAQEFDAVFSDSEIIVNNMAAMVEREFTVEDYIDDRNVFVMKKQETSTIMEDVISASTYPIGLYITFAPETSNGRDEIWYIKNRKGDVNFIDSINMSDTWLEKEKPSTAYYFQTIREGSMWFEANYDPGMDGETVTYARTLYDRDGALIGVIGVDILVDDIFVSLNEINEETGGYAAFIETDNGVIAGKDVEEYRKSEDYVYASHNVGERWNLALVQPIDIAVEPIVKTEAAVILLGILIVITVVIAIVYYSKKHVKPIIREVELKDAILINQARQAKMGEMVGNIAHQWKQPLNSIKMALSNMQDDYNNGALEREDFEYYVYKMNLMVDDLAETADDFTAFLRPGKKTEVFSANNEIKRVIDLTDEKMRLYGIDISVEGDEVFLEGYRNEFGQCIFNLLDNAFDALKNEELEDKRIEITLKKTENSTGTVRNVISVFNNGKPIDENIKDEIFDIYFTTKEDNEGTGIGLYLVRQILRSHFNGDIRFENTGEGVCFVIESVSKTRKGKKS